MTIQSQTLEKVTQSPVAADGHDDILPTQQELIAAYFIRAMHTFIDALPLFGSVVIFATIAATQTVEDSVLKFYLHGPIGVIFGASVLALITWPLFLRGEFVQKYSSELEPLPLNARMLPISIFWFGIIGAVVLFVQFPVNTTGEQYGSTPKLLYCCVLVMMTSFAVAFLRGIAELDFALKYQARFITKL